MEELSQYSIFYFFNLDDTLKKCYLVNMNLQIINVNKDFKDNLYLTLSDSLHFYDGFISTKKNTKVNLENFEIIKIQSVFPILDKNKEKLFSIKIKGIVRKCGNLVGNPIHYLNKANFNEYNGINQEENSQIREFKNNLSIATDEKNLIQKPSSDSKNLNTNTTTKMILKNILKTNHLSNVTTQRPINFDDSFEISNFISPIVTNKNAEKTEDFVYHTFDSFKKSKSQEKISASSQERQKTKENKDRNEDMKFSILNTRDRARVINHGVASNFKVSKLGMIEFSDNKKEISRKRFINGNLKEKTSIVNNFNDESKLNLEMSDIKSNLTANNPPGNIISTKYLNKNRNIAEDPFSNLNIDNTLISEDISLDICFNPNNLTTVKIHNTNMIKSPEIPPRTSISARQIQPINPKITKISIDSFNKPKTTGKKYFFPIAMLSDLINSFHTLGKVVDIFNYPNSMVTIIKDSENSYAKVVFNYKLKELFKDKIKLKRDYIFSNGEVEDVRYRHVRINDKQIKFVIKLNNSSNVVEYNENQELIESDTLEKFATLSQLEDNYINNNFMVDVLVYVLNINRDKDNKQYYNTKLICTDASNMTIEISLIKILSEKEIKYADILWVKNAIITFNAGYSLITSPISSIEINPDTTYTKAKDMKNYCDNYIGRYLAHKEVYNKHIGLKYHYIRDVLHEMDRNLYAYNEFSFKLLKARIISIIHNKKNTYIACPNCKRGLKQELNMPHKCENCNKFLTNPKYCYCFHIRIVDCSSEADILIFDELGDRLFKIDAERYTNALFNNDVCVIKNLNNLSNQLIYKMFYFHVKPRIKLFRKEHRELTLVNFEEVSTTGQIKDESVGLIKKFYKNLN